MRRLFVVIAGLVFLSGCLNSQGEDQARTDDQPPADEIPATNLSLTGCNIWASEFTWPRDMAPGQHMPTWGPWSPQLATSVKFEIISCDRVTWGAKVVPDAILILEHYSKSRPPDTCIRDERISGLLIYNVWSSSPELATYVNETLRMPTKTMDVTVQETSLGVGTTYEIAWTALGSDVSADANELVFSRVLGDLEEDRDVTQRFFWDHGSGVGSIGWDETYRSVGGNAQPAFGTIGSDTLQGSAGYSEWAGTNGVRRDLQIATDIQVWEDYRCMEEASWV